MLNLELNKRLLFYSCIATLSPTLWSSSTISAKGGNERPDSAAVSAVGSAQSRVANSPQCLVGKCLVPLIYTQLLPTTYRQNLIIKTSIINWCDAITSYLFAKVNER